MVTIPPIKMVMTGGWFLIVLPTLQPTKKLIEYRIKSPLITIFKQSYGPKYQLSILSVRPTF